MVCTCHSILISTGELKEEEMTKGKAKNSNDSLAPPQLWSLRSRKRECPSDEISKTDDVQAPLHHQDTDRNNTAVDATPPQCHPSPVQESDMISAQRHQAAEQACLTEQDPATKERHTTTNASDPNNGLKLEGFGVHTDNDVNKSGENKEEITAEECDRSHMDQLQVLLPTSEEGDGSRATALEEQVGGFENSPCYLERNQETQSHGECSSGHTADVQEVPKEAGAGLPAKKKRRMGMCGLTEKERSHFLQTQKRENGQNGPERAEKQMCNDTAGLVAQGEIIPAPALLFSAGSVTEQNKVEIKPQSSHGGGDNRAQTEVHIAVTTSEGTDGASAGCDPACSQGRSCDAEGSLVSDPEQAGDTNQEQSEPAGCTAESVVEKPQEQMRDGADGSAVVDQSPAIGFHLNPPQNEESESQGAPEAVPLQVNNVTGTKDEKRGEYSGDAGEGERAEADASSADTRSGGFSSPSVELCEAAVTPSGSEKKDTCDPDDKPGAGPSTLNAVPPQTEDSTDPFGSGYLDYVSDSQLNTIALIEEEKIEREGNPGSADCRDATDLICGLIRELSTLNRKVMATHRELESLRRSSKSSRGSVR